MSWVLLVKKGGLKVFVLGLVTFPIRPKAVRRIRGSRIFETRESLMDLRHSLFFALSRWLKAGWCWAEVSTHKPMKWPEPECGLGLMPN